MKCPRRCCLAVAAMLVAAASAAAQTAVDASDDPAPGAFDDVAPPPASIGESLPEDAPLAPDVVPPDDAAPPPLPIGPDDFASDVAEGEQEADPFVEPANEFGGDDRNWLGLFGRFRVGPTAQVGLPHLLNFGFDALYDRTWGFGFATGKTSTSAVSPLSLQIASWDLRVRWHPGTTAAFFGLAYGEQRLAGKASTTITPKVGDVEVAIPTTIQIVATTAYLTPHVGWFKMWPSGLTIGSEIGVQLPIGSEVKTDVAFESTPPSQTAAIKKTKEYRKFETKVEDAARLLASSPLPSVTLLRFGWLF